MTETTEQWYHGEEFGRLMHDFVQKSRGAEANKLLQNYYGSNLLHLKPGERVTGNDYVLEPAEPTEKEKSFPRKKVFIKDKGRGLMVKLREGFFDVAQLPKDTDYRFIESLPGTSTIVRVYSPQDKEERVIKTFPPPPATADTAQSEFEACVTLAQAGYPVAQNPRMERLFFPWVDTFSYKWIEGKDLYDHLKAGVVDGKVDEAVQVAKLFGRHLVEVWGDLLEGRKNLPGGQTFLMGDNVLGGFVYTGKEDIKDAFVRIDLLGLGRHEEPAGLLKIARQAINEIGQLREFEKGEPKVTKLLANTFFKEIMNAYPGIML